MVIKRKKVLTVLVIVVYLLWAKPMQVQASVGENVWQDMNMDAVEEAFQDLFPEYRFDGEQVLSLIVRGKITEAVSTLLSGMADTIKGQFGEIRAVLAMILLLGMTAALFSNFADVFQSHQVSDITFYVIYLLLIAALLKVFGDVASTVGEMLNQLITFMQLLIPAYLLAVGAAAGAASATAYYQIFLIVAYIIEKCYLSLLMPVIYCFILLSVINGIWMEEKLNLLLELIEKAVGFCIKVSLGVITGFSLLQSMISPIVDALESSALKKAVSVIPGIGNLTEGMFELAVGSAVLIKNSIGVFITIVMLFICFFPVVKTLLLACALKTGAALTGIVSDKRLTNCANRVGDGSLMLLKLALSAALLFIISIAVVAGTTNRGM